jgi:hypothetical protein
MTVEFEYATFEPLVGTVFEVAAGGYDDALTLIEATPARRAIEGREGRCFSLVLRGSRTDLYFNSGVVTLRHPALGTLELTMSPLERCPAGPFEYQIVFN